MSLKNIDTSEKNVAVLEISINKDIFAETVTKIFRKNALNMTVPGFRKGKAPRSVIEKMYGKGIFYEDALNELVPGIVDEAIAESKVKVVSKPEIDVKTIDENGVELTARVYTKPEVEIKNYKGLEAKKTVISVSDKDIDDEIEKVRKRNARSVEITDRAAADGDEVVIDFDGYADGVPFDGGKAEGHKLKIGSKQFIPGFEDQIIGKSTGESFDVNVVFPEEYHAKELAGKEAVFKVTLHKINFEELPEVDDEFVKDVSSFDTVEEYRTDVKKGIEQRNDQSAETAVEEQLVDGIIANLEAEFPEIMFENETDNQLQDYAYRLQQQGIDLKLYLQYTGMDINQLRAQFRGNAERQVKTRLALEKICELENIAASEEDIEEEVNKISESYKMTVEEVKERINIDVIKEDIAIRKAVDFIKNNAVITKVEKTSEEFRKENEHTHDHNNHIHSEDCNHGHDGEIAKTEKEEAEEVHEEN